jgi:hypothetical protein
MATLFSDRDEATTATEEQAGQKDGENDEMDAGQDTVS